MTLNLAVVAVLGLVLCFAGVVSTHLAILLSGFGVSWLVSDALGAATPVSLVIGAAGALVAWAVVTLILRAALFVVGALAGGVVGARLYTLLQGDSRSVVVALVFVLAVAVLCGWLATRWRQTVLLLTTAFAGAGLLLGAVGRVDEATSWLRRPESVAQTVVAALVWVAVAGAGVWTQSRRSGATTGRRQGR